MYTIGHNFKVGDTVWAVDDTEVRNCIVTHIVLEVDSDGSDSTKDKVSYHLNPIDSASYSILVRDESETFPTFEAAVMFLADNTLTYPSSSTYTIDYMYTIDDIVWTFDLDTPLECNIVAVIIDMNHGGPTTIFYNMLPSDADYSAIERNETDIYATEQLAIDHLKTLMNIKYT
jgi:hypothetical protein